MIPSDKTERTNMIEYMLEFCTNQLDTLSSWESSFIESISERFDEKGTLSDRQCEKLEQIYDKL